MRTRSLAVLLVCLGTLSPEMRAQESPAPPPPSPSAPPAHAAPAPALPPAKQFSSVKIVCEGKVKSDGASTLIFTPANGEPKAIRVTLRKGMDRKEACRDLTKELQVALGGVPYDVNLYDPDKIKIVGQKGAKFGIVLGSHSVTGFTILLK